ncbi:MAG TPA: hypothetical protein VHI13_12245 [Candidatus Kapabacteria bacterium]|nr:hypothetical protein [Candidatus Kapabacteria bacterium]
MICDVCGHDRYRIVSAPVRMDRYELRDAQCASCGTQYVLRTILESFMVINPRTMKVEAIPIDRIHEYRTYLLGRGTHPQSRGMLDLFGEVPDA